MSYTLPKKRTRVLSSSSGACASRLSPLLLLTQDHTEDREDLRDSQTLNPTNPPILENGGVPTIRRAAGIPLPPPFFLRQITHTQKTTEDINSSNAIIYIYFLYLRYREYRKFLFSVLLKIIVVPLFLL